MKMFQIVMVLGAVIALLLVGAWFFFEQVANPRVVRELIEAPDGKRAAKVMLLTLPGGRRVPVNYLREYDVVYAGADGRWWRSLVGQGVPVSVLIRGETLTGSARAVLDDPEHTKRVFAKLRPNAVKGFGTLVEIQLDR